MQRLRRIRQTSFLYLAFPGASHSRFEHSIGVLHLASTTWKKLYDNQKQMAKTLSALPNYTEFKKNSDYKLLQPTAMIDEVFQSPYIVQTLRLAALMHDIGHPPFSHSGEKLLPSIPDIIMHNPDLPPYLKEFLLQRVRKQEEVTHEVFTVLLIDKVLNEIDNNPIHPRDVISILCPDIEPITNSVIAKHGINTLGQELLSSDLDIDRMDYLLRDSRECGVSYGLFDFARILDSLALYYDSNDNRIHVGLKFSGLAAYEDYLQARLLMHTQVYFHKTPMAAEAMLQNLARKISYTIPSDLDRFIRLDEYNILSDLERASEGDERIVLDDLFYKRNLWKRIFEVTDTDSDRDQMIAAVRETVAATGEEFEFMSYRRYFTCLPDGEQSPLKIIRKNRHQIPQIEAIEKHSRFYREKRRVELHRFYVTNHPEKVSYPELKEKILHQVQP